MRQIPLVFASFGSLFFVLCAHAASGVSSTSLTSTSVLSIDGTPVARVLRWEGGDLRANAVIVPPTTGGLATKSPGSAFVAPLMVQVALPSVPPLVALMNELISGKLARHTLRITEYNTSGVPASALELTGTMLSEVVFPSFDASSTPVGSVTMIFMAEQSAPVAAVATSATPSSPSPAATFQFAVDGLDGRGVVRVDSLAFRRPISLAATGVSRTPALSVGPLEIANLTVALNPAQSASWTAWWNEFIVRGRNDATNEKNGSLQLIDATGKPLGFAVNFAHLGILRVSRSPVPTGSLQTLEAELYVESVALSTAAATTTAFASTAATDTTQLLQTSPVAKSGSIATVAPTTVTAPAPTRAPLGTEVPPASTTTVQSGSVTAALNPADAGSRDPAQFPRVSGLTRTYYTGNYLATYTNEQASYTSTESVMTLVARVDAAAKAAGWTLASLTEGTNAVGKTVGERWTKGTAATTLDLSPAAAGGSQLQIQVYIPLPTN